MTHSGSHDHSHDQTADIRLAFLLNLAFTILEVVGGIWTNSLAILSDSLHDFGDSVSLGLAWYLGKVSERGRDERYSYGYRRFSLLAALINTLVLIAGSLFVLSQAIPRLFEPEHSNAPGMVGLAIVGIIVNGIAAWRVRRGGTLSTQVVAWHLFEDILGWFAILVVSIALLFRDIHVLDPILSILITAYVLINVLRNMRRTLSLFLQAVPENIDIGAIEDQINSLDGVESTHHTHAWSLDGEHHVLSTHVVMEESAMRGEVACVKEEIRNLCDDMDFSHSTIEIEYGEEDCRMAEE